MKKLQSLLLIVLVSVLVALVYFYFEAAARHSIDFIWNDWLKTNDYRWRVVPLCLVLGLAFFGLQHYLDPKSEKQESQGLGNAPAPTLMNLAKVLVIGFLSLIAGASLGPEAILVPASLLIGGIVGAKFFRKDAQATSMLELVGFVALFAAFFNSFIAGILGLLLVSKETKTKVTLPLVAVAVFTSFVTTYVLSFLESKPFIPAPAYVWKLSPEGALVLIGLIAAGYVSILALGNAHSAFSKIQNAIQGREWWQHGLVAALGLSVLYLLGGPLVQFTGNESIVPMMEQSARLGLSGLLVVLLMKILAIAWSKALGYRGGLVFPSILIASTLIMIARIWEPELSFILGLIAVLIGMFWADKKARILI